MVICIDIGNSNVKCALLDKGGIVREGRREALSGLGRRSWRSIIEPLTRGPHGEEIRGVIIASVVPSLTPAAEAAARRLTASLPIIVGSHLRLPFSLSVPFPLTVGADRICCAAGAINKRRRHAILIDMGSAITVDLVVDASFKGGVILPGFDIALRSLASHTEQLPKLEYPVGRRRLSKKFDTTERSMLHGARASTVGGIKESVSFLEKEAGRHVPKFLTGGAAGVVSESLPRTWTYDSHLVLKGLYRIWALNAPPDESTRNID